MLINRREKEGTKHEKNPKKFIDYSHLLSSIVTELFLRGRKLNISLLFISQSYFKVTKDIRLNATHCFIMKTPSRKELQQIASNYLSDIEFKDFMTLQRDHTKEPYNW